MVAARKGAEVRKTVEVHETVIADPMAISGQTEIVLPKADVRMDNHPVMVEVVLKGIVRVTASVALKGIVRVTENVGQKRIAHATMNVVPIRVQKVARRVAKKRESLASNA